MTTQEFLLNANHFSTKIGNHFPYYSNVSIINKCKWETLIIAYPKSKLEQQNIVKKLDTLLIETKNLETIYQQKVKDLEELKKSVLQKAFNGELKTVNTLV